MLYLERSDEIIGAFALEDEVRPEARDAVADLQQIGVKVAMITGDARQVAEAVAKDLGIDEVFAEVLPEDKDQAVVELQQRGLSVAMVGDGVNDAPALARADVGIAIGAGTDVAIESAGVVLASSDPRGVAGVIRLSRASYRKMIAEPRLGSRIQHRRHPTRRRRARLGRHHPLPGSRRGPDEPVDDRRRPQRPTAATRAAHSRQNLNAHLLPGATVIPFGRVGRVPPFVVRRPRSVQMTTSRKPSTWQSGARQAPLTHWPSGTRTWLGRICR